ncbi:uncharacterized protein LOC110687036 [Chenopodium quinoa]|uniref:uncharacterized protein LOC110687036 n=1 Tax=Chenopodium quinoa TaxID=63459 RepID=UPI000B77DF5E|nr:uncharacterized protein LOC110687036 [Chenopodium quinoa]
MAQFDLRFVPQKSIKGSAVSDFLANFPLEDSTLGCGVEVILVSPNEENIPISIKLDFDVSKNAAEYEAHVVGLEIALVVGVKKLRIFGDSSLIINQISKRWKVRSESLAPYQTYLETLTNQLDKAEYAYLQREENQFAGALVRLASMVRIPKETKQMPLTTVKRHKPAYVQALEDEEEVQEDEGEPWYIDILNYVTKGENPPNTYKREKRALGHLASQYVLIDGELHKRVPKGRALLCVGKKEAQKAMRIIHEGACRTHMNGKMLAQKVMRQCYY